MQIETTYRVHGHTVVRKPDGTIACDTCSISAVIAKAIEFMYVQQVRSLVVDGTAVERLR